MQIQYLSVESVASRAKFQPTERRNECSFQYSKIHFHCVGSENGDIPKCEDKICWCLLKYNKANQYKESSNQNKLQMVPLTQQLYFYLKGHVKVGYLMV
jgi:hypothetical protein